MALAYTTGTINQPDAGSVGLAMANKIRDDVVAHAAWELVEEFTPASSVVRWTVLKCLMGVSGLPKDFYFVIGRTLSNGELRFMLGEDYNSGSHTLTKYGHTSTGTFDVDGCSAAAFTLGTAQSTGSSAQPKYISWTPSGTSTKWWIIVADDTISVAFNGAANGFVHAGVYVPLTQLAILVPLQIIGYSDAQGAITRNPAVATLITPSGSPMHINGCGGTSPFSNGVPLGFQGDLRYNDKLQNNQRPVAELGMHLYDPGMSSVAITGWVLGKQKRIRAGQNAPAGFAFGDAYVLNGTLWVPFQPSDFRMWDTGVASS